MRVGIIGIDPGAHGSMSFVSLDGAERKAYSFAKLTYHDIVNLLIEYDLTYDISVFIEEVHAMPKDGKVQAFSFGKNYGILIGLLTALKLPRVDVLPVKWQSYLKLRVRGLEYRDKKKALRDEAIKRFPQLSPTLETCDALLIAEYGRQITFEERKLVLASEKTIG